MKIKQTRQVRLDELLPLVWSNNFDYLVFKSDNNGFITFDMNGMIKQAYGITPDDIFTITEKIDITEDTPLQRAMVIKNNLDFYSIKNRKINSLKTTNIKFIYLQNEDGSIGDLIWKDGEMID